MALQLPCSKVYTLTRGQLACFDGDTIVKMCKEERPEIVMKRIKAKYAKKKDFSGGSSVTFRTNADITVTRLAFWGQACNRDAEYFVSVSFSQGSQPGRFPCGPPDKDVAKLFLKVKFTQNVKFYVDFPDGVPIKKGFWNKFFFVLEGPKTRVCDGTKSSEKCPESQVEFDFHSSSNQMPEIHFRLT